MRYPRYYGWSAWLDMRQGESIENYTKRYMLWDNLVEGEITFTGRNKCRMTDRIDEETTLSLEDFT